MVIEVKKRNNESTEGLLRRFKRRIQQSRLLIKAKNIKFYKKEKTKRERKESALRRKEAEKKREYLRRIGKLEDVSETGYPYQKKK